MSWTGDEYGLLESLAAEMDRRLDAALVARVRQLVTVFFERFPLEDLGDRTPADLFGMVMLMWRRLQDQPGTGPASVYIDNPGLDQHGWQSDRTVIIVVGRNRPFMMDSVRLTLNRAEVTIHTLHSSQLLVQRDPRGGVLAVGPAEEGGSSEAFLYLEIGRINDTVELTGLRDKLLTSLRQVEVVVDDWPAMRARMESCLTELASPGYTGHETSEACELLRWLLNDNFTFLAYEELAVDRSGASLRVRQVGGQELGLWRQVSCDNCGNLEEMLLAEGNDGPVLRDIITLSRNGYRSSVHRDAYAENIAIRRFGDTGELLGEYVFTGLFSSNVYIGSVSQIPYVRRKVAEVMRRSGLQGGSHGKRYLRRVLELFPRDELFHLSADELFGVAIAINRIQERRLVRLFPLRDPYGAFMSFLVYMPRDNYSTARREQVQYLLEQACSAIETEFSTFFSHSVLVRTHFVMRLAPGAQVTLDAAALEDEIRRLVREWHDVLGEALAEEFGEQAGNALARQFQGGFPRGYQDDHDPRFAALDIPHCIELHGAEDLAMRFYRRPEDPAHTVHFRLYRLHQSLVLSEVIPLLENLGLVVLTERPYRLSRRDGTPVWIHDFELRHGDRVTLRVDEAGAQFKACFEQTWRGNNDNDGFNRLLLRAGLDWRRINLLRAYARFCKQLGYGFSVDFMADTLAGSPHIAGLLVDKFCLLFDPDRLLSREEREAAAAAVDQQLDKALEQVSSLNEDRVVRHLMALVGATLRTNFFCVDMRGQERGYLSLKIDIRQLPQAPLPRPAFEIFVHAPAVEGVHLRLGKVARGGVRWSDRLEDFRTEVLGLVKAQQVKNAIIVPEGAKGGFVVRRMASGLDAQQRRQLVEDCYRIFIRGLLDVTDNLVAGEVMTPPRVLARDAADYYLVVAADKGTATFSDLANGVAAEYGFWLGDAFASGGSAGYDHKRMGITARGAWVSVQRHFRERGVDIQTTPFTVIGIGDMSGDVFGNGMLLSPCIRLLAAFNHRHIFIDPEPDCQRSFNERQRLFALAGSGWDDYDPALISPGGGVFRRDAKSIAISPQMQRSFGITADRLEPDQLIRELLRARVDLLWNGGIGTFVKAGSEANIDIGDRTNDGVRINGCELGAAVVGEGGNLGLTQLGRVEFALAGGAVFTDFIDNAGGVNCSDHEVNIKIALNEAVARGEITDRRRLEVLALMEPAVAELVLEDSYRQTSALSFATLQASTRGGEYLRYIDVLEKSGVLDRALEFIPSDAALRARSAEGKSLTAPELAVVMAYTRADLKARLLACADQWHPILLREMDRAFPDYLHEHFGGYIREHRLARLIVATQLANDIVNTVGITYVHRMARSTGAPLARIACCYIIVREVFRLDEVIQGIGDLNNSVPAEIQLDMVNRVTRLANGLSRWWLHRPAQAFDPEQDIAVFRPAFEQFLARADDYVAGSLADELQQARERYARANVPAALAAAAAAMPVCIALPAIFELSRQVQMEAGETARFYFEVGEDLGIPALARRVAATPVESHWQADAREASLDKLAQLQRQVVESVLETRAAAPGILPADWMATRQRAIERWRSQLAELGGGEPEDYAAWLVLLRALEDIAAGLCNGQ